MAQYLLVIGNKAALAWVLREQQMAFPDFKRHEIRALGPGDSLFLYTTRGCFGDPNSGRSRVIAVGEATSAVTELRVPVTIGDRTYPYGCGVKFDRATTRGEGVEIGGIRPELDLFDGVGQNWSFPLRRPLVKLTEHDAKVIGGHLGECRLHPLAQVIAAYT